MPLVRMVQQIIIHGVQTEIATLLVDLETALFNAGMVDVDGALWNYVLILEDPSGGMHHPAYAKLLLNSTRASGPAELETRFREVLPRGKRAQIKLLLNRRLTSSG